MLFAPDAAVPVTVMAYVPAGVDADVASVSVDEPPDVTEAGENDAVAPADGRRPRSPTARQPRDCGVHS